MDLGRLLQKEREKAMDLELELHEEKVKNNEETIKLNDVENEDDEPVQENRTENMVELLSTIYNILFIKLNLSTNK